MNANNPMLSELIRPDFRKALETQNNAELRNTCAALHPAQVAEILGDLDPSEIWAILQACASDPPLQAAIFSYFDEDLQIAIVESQPPEQVARLIDEMPADDRVDMLDEVEPEIKEEILPLLSPEERQDVNLLTGYEEGTCGSEMSSDFVRLREDMTVGEAIAEISSQTHLMETVYYLYVLDGEGRLAGIVSAKDLLRRMNSQNERLRSFMKSAGTLITVRPEDSREKAVNQVGKYDFVAIPVVDADGKMLGVITHDDILDAAVEELVENAHMSAAVAPLNDEEYIETNIWSLARKRFVWLAILLFAEIGTALTMRCFEGVSLQIAWLVAFLPMIVSSGGNCGGQSATLVITALATRKITLKEWKKVCRREIAMVTILGLSMGVCALLNACLIYHNVAFFQLLIVPTAVFCIVFSSNLIGAMLPLLFQKLNFDPALMSNPFVAGISDTLGTLIYMALALWLLSPLY